MASQVGLHAEAMDAYQLLARKHPNEPRWSAAAEKERLLVVREWTPQR